MAGPSRPIFRAKALERISSPESIDQLMSVVSPKDWLPLLVLGLLAALAVAWSVEGRVPTTVSGRGILTHPSRISAVNDIQSLASGRIEGLILKNGDTIRAGETIASIDQFETRRRLEEDRALLAELKAQDRAKASVQTEQVRLQRQQTQLETTFLASQSEYLRKNLADAQAMEPLLKKRVDGLRTLSSQGLIAEIAPDLVEAEQQYRENSGRISDAASRLKQIDLQLKQSESRETGLNRENLDAETSRHNLMLEISARIASNEQQLEKYSRIVATHSGRVLEVFAANGQIVSGGTRIATLEPDGREDKLVSVAYFTVGDGKRIRPGMRVQITPDNVERQRFGGITGRVLSVSALPVTLEGAKSLVGNTEVVQRLMQGGAQIEVFMEMDADPQAESGYQWSSSRGPSTKVDAGVTTSVRVIVESRAPITYFLPFLREFTGVN